MESETRGEEEEDKEVEMITATPLRFPRHVLLATTHLVPVGIHGILRFGQFKQSVVMMPISATMQPTIETRAVVESHPSPTEMVALEVMMELTRETLPEIGDETLVPNMEMDTETRVMEVPIGEELGALGV